jgi:asparagine synthase (glutamine-hydrolysing)
MDRYVDRLDGLLPRPLRQRMIGAKVRKVAQILRAHDQDALFLQYLSAWSDPGPVVGVLEPLHATVNGQRPPLADFFERMMCTDAVLYLPDDILAKVDRATMGVSLEGRVPMLDPAVAAFACSLPLRLKVRGRKGKGCGST